MLYSKTKNTNGNINSILSINGRINKIVELDIGAVLIILYKPCIKQLGIIITNGIICI